MTDTVYNVSKHLIADGGLNFDAGTVTIKALLLTVADTGYDDPDNATVAAVLAQGTTAEPAAGERVTITNRDTENDATNNRANVRAGTNSPSAANMATFAADAGETAVAVLFYDATTDTNDTTRIPISVHDFTSVPLDGGLTINPSDANGDWLRIT